ncbi:predicted protein, partial [Nematostella vectensis]
MVLASHETKNAIKHPQGDSQWDNKEALRRIMPRKPRFRRNDRGEVILQQIRAAAKDKQRNKDAAKPTSVKHPHEPQLISSQPPKPDCYFAQPLLLWMPRKLWKVVLKCPQAGCNRNLTSAGLYQKTRQVVDIDGNYNLADEYLECGQCKKKVISWSPAIVSQLDPGHKLQFPVILTYKYACDVRVVRMLRNRGFGNNSSMLQKKLTEQYSEKWLQKTIH